MYCRFGDCHPAQFEASLVRNCKVTRHFTYSDHHIFKPEEVEEWRTALAGDGMTEAIITTEKDAARLRNMSLPEDLKVLVMGMQVKWWDEAALHALLTSIDKQVEASTPVSDI